MLTKDLDLLYPHPHGGRVGRRLPEPGLQLLEVGHVSDLAGRLHALELVRDVPVSPALTKVLQGVVRVGEDPELDQEDADHGPGPALAALAVYRDHVGLVGGQPLVDLGKE